MKFGSTAKKSAVAKAKKSVKKAAAKTSKFGRPVHPDFEGDAPKAKKSKKSAFSSKRSSPMTLVPGNVSHGDMSALITNTADIERELKDEQDRRGRSQLWMRLLRVEDGTPKRVWFRSAKPLGALFMHRVPNGRGTSDLVPCSEHALNECELCAASIPRSFYFVFDVVDIDGYYDKRKRKSIKNKPCFYLMSQTRYETFVKQMRGSEHLLEKRLVEVERIGSGPQTMHLFKLLKDPVPSAAQNQDSMEAESSKYFSVVPLDEQQRLLKSVTSSKSHEDADD